MVALAAAGGGAVRPARAQEPEVVTVVMVEYAFRPSQLRFRLGARYRLHLANQGAELHEFTAPAFLAAVDVANPDVLVETRNEVVLQPKEEKDVFLVPRRAGRFPLICADHDTSGMVGEIVVE